MARSRQAVIVIHGIGEQRPMDTLRGFVNSLMLDMEVINEKVKFYNKPDVISESFELRTLCVYPTKGRARTDFFEYYWAYNMRGTSLGHVFSWLWRMLFRWYTNVPRRIRWLYFLFWVMVAILVVLVATGILNPSLVITYKKHALTAALVYLIVNAINLFLIRYLGDAARYTDASPENIEERQQIRGNGIKLLKGIHESGKYDRVVVVGHSLGTMIGYDMIKHYWIQCNDKHGDATVLDQKVLREFESKYGRTEPPGRFKEFNLSDFQKDQTKLLDEERRVGNPWLVTDFITLGSPLVYSSVLLADTQKELVQRQTERELPIAPPIAEKEKTLSYPMTYTVNGVPVTKSVLHHAACFACTQWHNGYYKNDFVGGPLQTVFGQGILDYKMTLPGVLGKIPFLSHTHYWGNEQSIIRERTSVDWLRKLILPDYQRKSAESDS